ncbi:MAG: hypothetical protein HZA51_18480 [Planctomycetes bacterium]|nr:hypothetical protein [Planctomycetota bacterium]
MPRLQLSPVRIVGVLCGIISTLAVSSGKPPGAWAWVAFGGAHIASICAAWCVARGLAGATSRRASSADVVLTMQVYFALWVCLGIFLGALSVFVTPSLYIAAAVFSILALFSIPADCTCPRIHWKAAILFAPLILVVLWQAVWSPEYVYDTLTYHLFFPARWVQDHAISIIPTWCGGPIPDYAPSSTEVYYAALMLPFRADWLARGGQFPYWLLLLAATWSIAREMRLRRNHRLLVTIAVAALPGPAMQAATALVDVALAAHLLCIVLYSLRFRRTSSQADAVGLLLSLGAFLGTKFLALAFLVPLFPMIAWCVLRRRDRTRFRSAVLSMASAAAFTIGPSWHVRNWLVTGNPVYPMEVSMAGATIFSGAYGHEQMANSPMNARRNEGARALPRVLWQSVRGDTRLAGFAEQLSDSNWHRWIVAAGGASSALLFLAIAAGAWLRRERTTLALQILSLLLLAAFWWLLPFQDHRFAIGPIMLVVISIGSALRSMRKTPFMLSATLFACGVMSFAPTWLDWMSRTKLVDTRSQLLASWRHEWKDPVFGSSITEAWDWCDESLHNTRIAYVGTNIPYFLLGRSFENQVNYCPATLPTGGRFHDFARTKPETMSRPNTAEPAMDRFVMNPQVWLDNLREKQIEYVMVHSVRMFPMLTINISHDADGFPIEIEWMEELCRSGAADRVRSFNNDVVVYRLANLTTASLANRPTVVQLNVDAIEAMKRKNIRAPERVPEFPFAYMWVHDLHLWPP